MHKTLAAALLCLTAACAQPQRLVRLHSSPAQNDPLGVVVRTLVENGYQPAEVDEQRGILHTAWEDTGFRYGQIRGLEATIHRRFTALVTRGAEGNEVTLRFDTRRCQPARTVVTSTPTQQVGGNTVSVGNRSVSWGGTTVPGSTMATQVDGACETMDGLVEDHQRDLDVMGEKLRAAL